MLLNVPVHLHNKAIPIKHKLESKPPIIKFHFKTKARMVPIQLQLHYNAINVSFKIHCLISCYKELTFIMCFILSIEK